MNILKTVSLTVLPLKWSNISVLFGSCSTHRTFQLSNIIVAILFLSHLYSLTGIQFADEQEMIYVSLVNMVTKYKGRKKVENYKDSSRL